MRRTIAAAALAAAAVRAGTPWGHRRQDTWTFRVR